MKSINIPVQEKEYYKVYLNFLNPILELTKKEIDIMGELLFWYKHYELLDEDIRNKMVFDYDNKCKIMETLQISHQTLLNGLYTMRQKGWIENNTLSKKFLSLFDFESNIMVVKFTKL